MYCAATWNSHRIHYDADYARTEEGYPAALVNGDLTIQLMLDAVTVRTSGRLRHFSARLNRPLHVGDRITIAGQALVDGRTLVWVEDEAMNLCGSIRCVFD